MNTIFLRGNGLSSNTIFDLSSHRNRDNCFAPYIILKERFFTRGIKLDAVDIKVAKTSAAELHINVQKKTTSINNYLLMLETPFIEPSNGNHRKWGKYKKIFTWNDDLLNNKKFIKINFPNLIKVYSPNGFVDRQRLCCIIAGNKALKIDDARDLYKERIKAIRWFEKSAPNDFDLYGVGWGGPPAKSGFYGRVERKLWEKINRFFQPNFFSSYRGKVVRKSDVLTRTRFSICYENVRDLPGYITEKIFDCFFSGCVPVYWGASNINQYIPEECFIDRRKFDKMIDLYNFLKKMPEDRFTSYQQHIADFLRSDAAYPFGIDFFSDTIINTIVQDIDCQN